MLLICQNHAQYYTRFHIPKNKTKKYCCHGGDNMSNSLQYIIKNFTHINIRLSILNVNNFINHVKIKWGVHLQYLHSHIVFVFVSYQSTSNFNYVSNLYIAVDHDIYNISQFDHYQINEPILFLPVHFVFFI